MTVPNKRRSPLAILAIIAAIVLSSLALTPAHAATTHVGSGTWQVLGPARSSPTFYRPTGLAIDKHGDLYLLDSGNFRVVKLAPGGRILTQFGRRGSGPGQFGPTDSANPGTANPGQIGPESLTLDRQGNVYVADTGNNRVEKFSASGRYLAEWPLTVAGSIVNQIAVATGGSGNIIVAIGARVNCPATCASYYVVQRRAPSGRILVRWRSIDPPTTPQNDPFVIEHLTLAVDAQGRAYIGASGIVDCYKSCPSFSFLEKRSADGRLLAHWSDFGNGLISTPAALAVGGRGNLFVADASSHRVEKRSSTDKVLARWTTFGGGPAPSIGPDGVTVDARGNVYVADTGNNRVANLSSSGRPLASWGNGGAAPGQFWLPSNPTLDSHGNIWVMDNGNSRVQELSSTGRPLRHWPVKTAGSALTLDSRGNVYLGQLVQQHIVVAKFSPSGRLLARLAQGDHLADPPEGLATDAHGNIFILADFYFPNDRDFTKNGLHILELSPTGRQLAYLALPSYTAHGALALDSQGNIYLTDTYRNRIYKLAPDGRLLATWGTKGSAPGQFLLPQGIALDRQGNIYVADSGNDRIQKLSPAGTSLAQWGSTGSAPGRFHDPTGIAVDANGSFFVSDTGNNRIQRFTP